MPVLNEQKPFGYVCGSQRGIAYEQDGKFFDALKRQIDEDGNLVACEDPVTADETDLGGSEGATEATETKPAVKKSPARKSATQKASPTPEGVRPMSETTE